MSIKTCGRPVLHVPESGQGNEGVAGANRYGLNRNYSGCRIILAAAPVTHKSVGLTILLIANIIIQYNRVYNFKDCLHSVMDLRIIWR